MSAPWKTSPCKSRRPDSSSASSAAARRDNSMHHTDRLQSAASQDVHRSQPRPHGVQSTACGRSDSENSVMHTASAHPARCQPRPPAADPSRRSARTRIAVRIAKTPAARQDSWGSRPAPCCHRRSILCRANPDPAANRTPSAPDPAQSWRRRSTKSSQSIPAAAHSRRSVRIAAQPCPGAIARCRTWRAYARPGRSLATAGHRQRK